MSFAPGTVVRLKSGGPDMTVGKPRVIASNGVQTITSPLVQCAWFEGKKLSHGSFAPDQLVEVNK